MTPGVPGAPEPRMYLHSGYFLVIRKAIIASFPFASADYEVAFY